MLQTISWPLLSLHWSQPDKQWFFFDANITDISNFLEFKKVFLHLWFCNFAPTTLSQKLFSSFLLRLIKHDSPHCGDVAAEHNVLCFVMCYYQSLAHNLIISLLCQKIFVKAIKIILICQYLCKSQQHQNRSRNKKEWLFNFIQITFAWNFPQITQNNMTSIKRLQINSQLLNLQFKCFEGYKILSSTLDVVACKWESHKFGCKTEFYCLNKCQCQLVGTRCSMMSALNCTCWSAEYCEHY